jgi:Cof subfamily protein (haloacid dehalogenase superfamily)
MRYNKMNEIKLICTDLDGTLLTDEKTINSYDKEMLKRAYEEKHIPVILASGRFKAGVLDMQEELGFPTGISCFNGSYIELNNKVIEDVRIKLKQLEKVIPIIMGNNSYPIIYDLEKAYMNDTGEWYELQERLTKGSAVATPLMDLLIKWEKENYSPFKLLAKDKDYDNLLRTKKLIDDAKIDGINTFLSSQTILEIVPVGISKASTVKIMCNLLNITKENVMSFGDYNNDLELIEASGYGIAMENAIDEVKNVAFAVTDTNNNNGIAKAIKKYIFNE